MTQHSKRSPKPRKNILLIMVDQMRFPRFSYGDLHGFKPPLKEILGFQGGDVDPAWAKLFPGFTALRRNSVVLRQHTIASSACIPSRATIMTGQYGTRTGVRQTDGLFKNGDAPDFPWLPPDGVPTIGCWMREAGYSTHYFGKWHVSNPPEHSLLAYGFQDWELSWPEPHGALVNNLGFYRDFEFADLAATFLRRRGLGKDFTRASSVTKQNKPLAADRGYQPPTKPWFAVASFTNPHDIATYPTLPKSVPDLSALSPEEVLAYMAAPLGVPPETIGDPEQPFVCKPPNGGTFITEMNPDGFPSDCAHLPENLKDSLDNKPRCQYDYTYKIGLGLASKAGWSGVSGKLQPGDPASADGLYQQAAVLARAFGIPFILEKHPDLWSLAFLRYYAYLQYTVDQHIAKVLQALEESGQAENTIVVFLPDHGEYGGSHLYMMEKWHTAYQEAVHVPVVIQSPDLNPNANMKQVDALTSHIDIAPTILGLAGVEAAERERIRVELGSRYTALEFVGADLSQLITTAGGRDTTEPDGPEPVIGADGTPRPGVLFITDDEISEPLNGKNAWNLTGQNEFRTFEIMVENVRGEQSEKNERVIEPGAIVQPNHVRCVRVPDWKLSRYVDPSGREADEWEMYRLDVDPNEMTNLLVYNGQGPTVIPTLPTEFGTPEEVQAKADELDTLLARLESEML